VYHRLGTTELEDKLFIVTAKKTPDPTYKDNTITTSRTEYVMESCSLVGRSNISEDYPASISYPEEGRCNVRFRLPQQFGVNLLQGHVVAQTASRWLQTMVPCVETYRIFSNLIRTLFTVSEG
jgi:hypothetical protein